MSGPRQDEDEDDPPPDVDPLDEVLVPEEAEPGEVELEPEPVVEEAPFSPPSESPDDPPSFLPDLAASAFPPPVSFLA